MTAVIAPRPVLADALPGLGRSSRLARESALVVAGTALLTLISQIAVPLPFTPVPLTLGTFGALFVGASLGPARGATATGLYAVLAACGAPVLAGWSSQGVATASFGYVVGYVLAGAALGAAARRGADRSVRTTALAAVAATALVYVAGVPWLMVATGSDLGTALTLGVAPFLVGDAVKAVACALLLPAAWHVIDRARTR